MGKGKFQSGRKLKIEKVVEYRNSSEIGLVVNNKIIRGRPIVVLKKFIDLGYERGYYDHRLISALIEFGFDRGYWTDKTVFAEPFKYALFDKNFPKSKAKRLKEFEEELEEVEEE